MNILVTVGSSTFDSLIQAADKQISAQDYQVTCQTARGGSQSQHHASFEFSNDFDQYLTQADIVITHGGAGTIFRLLELGKKFIMVPNLERVDDHQLDLAQYVEERGYGIVCRELPQLGQCLKRCLRYTPTPYQKDSFFKARDIVSYLKD